MILVSSCGKLGWLMGDNIHDFCHNGKNMTSTFNYPEVVHSHFQLWVADYSNNSDRMEPIALEDACDTTRWTTGIFTFLLAVVKFNFWLSLTKLYSQPESSHQGFIKIVSDYRINNYYINKNSSGRTTSKILERHLIRHEPQSLPKI